MVERKGKRHEEFMLPDISGDWKSGFNSPDIKIFREGRRFWLTLKYRLGAAFSFQLRQDQEHVFFYFYDFIQIDYDQEKDLLILSTEGIYNRTSEL